MRALTAIELLEIWERGATQAPTERGLILLAAACPDQQPAALAQLSIGQRDAQLLTLRESTFGPQLVCTAVCPSCSERLEATFAVNDIRAPYTSNEAAATFSLAVENFDLSVRLPNSLDLAAVATLDNLATARQILLQRCLLSARRQNENLAGERLPENVVTAVVERMAAMDPQANVQLSFSCPRCPKQWLEVFDILTFFWNELNAWAQQRLREVHLLASAYGWREADILAMGPMRRRLYLEMIAS